MDHISFDRLIKTFTRYALLVIILSWSMTFAIQSLDSVNTTNHEVIDIAGESSDKDMNEEPASDPVNVTTEVSDRLQFGAPTNARKENETWSAIHQNVIRNGLKSERGDGNRLLPFKHMNDLGGADQFNPESLQKSVSHIAQTMERTTTKGGCLKQGQKSPTLDLVREALDFGFTMLSPALDEPPIEESVKKHTSESEEGLRSKGIISKEDEPQLMEYAAQFLKERLETGPTSIPEEFILQAVNQSTHLKSTSSCDTTKDITCPQSRYQSFDGSCNNLKNPLWGAVNSCQVRLLPACYEDGISKMRSTSVNGKALPSGVYIADRIICEGEQDNIVLNMWSVSIGQLLAHDLGKNALRQTKCCPHPDRSECLNFFTDPNIILPPEARCIYSPRSESCAQCKIGPRDVINAVTGLIDLSPLYGSDSQKAESLRLGESGLMRFGIDNDGGIILPKSESGDVACAPQFERCVDAGDRRVVENPGILLAQNTVLRFHNIIAELLAKLNPKWSDETLFQEARKVVIMHWQRIVYEEYLPLLMGPRYYCYYQLDKLQTKYNPKINPGALVEFLAGAFRIGHSMAKSLYKLEEGKGRKKALQLKPNYFNPTALFKGKVDLLSSGLLDQPAAMADVCMAADVKKFLYWTRFEDYTELGRNLAAADIERGRDHGVAPYPAYVQYCFGIKIDSWKDLESIMSSKNIARLHSVYKSVWDVDLWTGGLHESRIKNGMVGPTFNCLLGVQFYNLKYGDRFFYTHYDKQQWYPAGLNIGQNQASPLHNLLCLATDADSVLERPLEIQSKVNQPKPCDYLPYQYTRRHPANTQSLE